MKKGLKNAIAFCVLWPAAMVAGFLLRIAEWFDEWIDERNES